MDLLFVRDKRYRFGSAIIEDASGLTHGTLTVHNGILHVNLDNETHQFATKRQMILTLDHLGHTFKEVIR